MAQNLYGSAVPEEALGNIGSACNLQYNGTAFEALKGNTSQTIMAASSVSASTAVLVTNTNGRGIIAWMEITSGLPPGSASVTIALKVQMVAPVGTNRFKTLATSGPGSASGSFAVAIYPGMSSTAVTGVSFNAGIVPRDLRILASISSAAASFGCVMALGVSFLS